MSETNSVERPVGLLHAIRRWWSATSQKGTGGLLSPGDWRCVYPDGNKTRWMSHGDANNCRQLWGGALQWRHDQPNAEVSGAERPLD